MAKSTLGKSASDKAFDNVWSQINKINRGQISAAHQDLYKKKEVKLKPDAPKSASLTAAIANRPMRTRKAKKAIQAQEAALALKAAELGVSVEVLRKYPNLRKK